MGWSQDGLKAFCKVSSCLDVRLSGPPTGGRFLSWSAKSSVVGWGWVALSRGFVEWIAVVDGLTVFVVRFGTPRSTLGRLAWSSVFRSTEM